MTQKPYLFVAGCLAILLLALAACGSGDEPAADTAGTAETAETAAKPGGSEAELLTEDDKTLYALGLAIAGRIKQFGVDERELAVVQQGLADAVLERQPKVDLQQYGPKIQILGEARAARLASGETQAAAEYLNRVAAESDAVRTASGLIITELAAGTGVSPSATDEVRVHYHGTLRDGRVFDSSVDRGTPATFRLNGVIPCWTEGLQRMRVGGKSRLVCPSEIAYGLQGRPPQIPPGAALTFEVELLEIL